MRQSKYSQEFKDSTVQLIINNNESVVKVAEDLDLNPKSAKNGNIWTQFPKTLEQCLHFYLNTNFGDYLNTYLDKPKN